VEKSDPITHLSIVVTGDTRGALEDCGCEDRLSGGIARRQTAFDALGNESVLKLDLGGVYAAGGDQDLYLGRSTVLLYTELGYEAVNFGWGEARAGPETVIESDAESGLLISSNLVDLTGGYPLPRYRILTSGEVRVLVAGVLSQGALTEFPGGRQSAFRIEDPLQSLESVLQEAQGQFDVAIGLCHLFEPEANILAKRLQGYDLLIGGWRISDRGRKITESGTPLFLFNGDRGRGFALIRIPIKGSGEVEGFLQELDDGFPREHNMTTRVEDIRKAMTSPPDRLEGVPLPLPFEPRALPRKTVYLGSRACLPCHGSQSADYALTGHAYSMVPLILKGESQNSDCLPCHVTAFGINGGFRSRLETPLFADVGCEACHGPGSRHVALETSLDDVITHSGGNGADPNGQHGIVPTPGQDTCIVCHDAENDPDFDYNRDLRKVAHRK
jgi:hypothetical protein